MEQSLLAASIRRAERQGRPRPRRRRRGRRGTDQPRIAFHEADDRSNKLPALPASYSAASLARPSHEARPAAPDQGHLTRLQRPDASPLHTGARSSLNATHPAPHAPRGDTFLPPMPAAAVASPAPPSGQGAHPVIALPPAPRRALGYALLGGAEGCTGGGDRDGSDMLFSYVMGRDRERFAADDIAPPSPAPATKRRKGGHRRTADIWGGSGAGAEGPTPQSGGPLPPVAAASGAGSRRAHGSRSPERRRLPSVERARRRAAKRPPSHCEGPGLRPDSKGSAQPSSAPGAEAGAPAQPASPPTPHAGEQAVPAPSAAGPEHDEAGSASSSVQPPSAPAATSPPQTAPSKAPAAAPAPSHCGARTVAASSRTSSAGARSLGRGRGRGETGVSQRPVTQPGRGRSPGGSRHGRMPYTRARLSRAPAAPLAAPSSASGMLARLSGHATPSDRGSGSGGGSNSAKSLVRVAAHLTTILALTHTPALPPLSRAGVRPGGHEDIPVPAGVGWGAGEAGRVWSIALAQSDGLAVAAGIGVRDTREAWTTGGHGGGRGGGG